MDEKISRGKLVKGGAAGALAVGALGVVEAAGAQHPHPNGAILIHIHGVLTGTPHGGAPGVRLAISIDVAGRRTDLAGAGWDSGIGTTGTGMKPGGEPPGGPVGACYYTASGSLNGTKVTLVGRSLWTNRDLALADSEDPGKSDTRADGRNFNGTADLVTGEITWSLSPGGAAFAGKGLVVLTKADQVSNP
jgi:hypothetical protein